MEISQFVGADVHRNLLAHSAVLIGKSMKVQKAEATVFPAMAGEFMDSRDDLVQKMQAALVDAMGMHGQEPLPAEAQSVRFRLASLSARLGLHQRTRSPPPTTKTKRPKAHHKRRR